VDLSRPTLELAIDEVVLDGVEPGDPLVVQAVQRAIGDSLRGQDVSAHAIASAVSDAIGQEGSP
jgi:hypothetical protein